MRLRLPRLRVIVLAAASLVAATAVAMAGVIGFAGFALSPTALGMWLSIPVFELMGLTQPAMQALMTRHVGESEQGQLQGANGAIMGLTGIVSSATFDLS